MTSARVRPLDVAGAAAALCTSPWATKRYFVGKSLIFQGHTYAARIVTALRNAKHLPPSLQFSLIN